MGSQGELGFSLDLRREALNNERPSVSSLCCRFRCGELRLSSQRLPRASN